MEVITQRPIYNYASGGDDFSYLTKEEKATKRKENAQKRKEKANAFLQSDYTKATVGALTGVGAQKIQNWASTGSFGNKSPIEFDPNAFNIQSQGNLVPVEGAKDEKGEDKSAMGIWTKVGIGVGIVAVLGVATYFILKSKKGKSSKK
jgi:hypothetical protein